ncbi:MAG: ATP-dependent DNA ligase [Verrucomicrobia bacterium]|nr:ATP-dependent DNA ligase [Verrucomicrobiota bacterium]
MMKVTFERGILLPELDLWLDPWDERDTAFVSHAHTDHIGNHREVILSETTAKLMAARLPGQRLEHALPFQSPIQFRGATVTLLPAGHVFGSAQVCIKMNGETLLYTGDFKLRKGKSAEAAEWLRADTLIMETTYGLPKYIFPPAEQVIAAVTKFCVEALEENLVPILFGYSLGKAQEILAGLHGSGLRILLHPSVYKITRLYEKLRKSLPQYLLYDESRAAGSVVICPPAANRTRLVQRIKNRRTAVLTGWALNPATVHRYQCDAAFPLSDHADYSDLIKYVELVQPKRVFTVHGFASEFALDLRRRGIEAWSLAGDNQLELVLTTNAPAAQPVPIPDISTATESGFLKFAKICNQIAQLTGKLRKIDILSNYLVSLTEEELPVVATFLTGHAFSRKTGKTLQVGWAVISKALIQASGLSETDFRNISAGYGDAGRVAYDVLLGRTTSREIPIREVADTFAAIQDAIGPMAKTALLADCLQTIGPDCGDYIVRIMTGDLRIGLKEGLLEEAIAAAFAQRLGQVKEVNMLTGDIGETAQLAKANRLSAANLTLFQPVRCMLAIPESSAEEIWDRVRSDFAADFALAEAKYDGVRAQLHGADHRTELYSRDLRNISEEFPELTCLRFAEDLILDGELVAFGPDRKLSFFDLQRRLGRKRALDLFETDDIPVLYMVFDLLWLNGETLLKTPLKERRRRLDQLALPDRVKVSPMREVTSIREIDEAYQAARSESYEGLMIKASDSLYTPGRRGGAWIKFKRELATLDVVVVGVEQGHGKRSHVLSDYTFSVRDEETGALQTIGKAYSGLRDDEIEELTEHFLRTTIRHEHHFREVVPEIVLEIAFDSVQPSDRHASGLALRFPRIKAIRRDKKVTEIDTVQYARRLVHQV